MANRQFRFRLPWFSAVTPPRPPYETQPPRPTAETQASAQPTTTIPIQGPPFQPAGIAPAPPPPPQVQAPRPPPQVQAPQRTEPQPASPPHVATESQVAIQPQTQAASVPSSPSRATTQTQAASVPPSPTRTATKYQVAVQPQKQATSVPASPSRATTQTHAASVPPSPSRGTAQPRVASVPLSPSRAATESRVSSQPASPAHATTQTRPASQSPSRVVPQSKVASVQPSPSRTTSQPQPAEQTAPQLPFIAHLAFLHASQTVSQPTSPSRTTTQAQSTDSQVPSPSEKIQLNIKETSQPPPTAAQQEQTKPAVSSPLSQATQQKMDIASEIVLKLQEQAEPIKASDSEKKVEEAEEGQKVVEELKKEEKTNGLGTQAKDLPSSAFHAEQQLQKEDSFERKKATIISSNKERIKTEKANYISSESHQKPMMSNGEKVPLHKEIREDISKFVQKLGSGHPNQFTGERPVSIVTLAGENRGATMLIGSEPVRKDGSVHIHRGYKINADDSSQTTTDGEGSSQGRKSKDPLTKENPATKAYINSNTQSVNNSIVFESSVHERDPGVRLILSHNQTEPTKSSTKPGPFETHKTEFNITPAEKLTYEPTVRRRCLRGLFLESSDSDPDNPEKPRRHGCRYNCGKKSKDKDIGVL